MGQCSGGTAENRTLQMFGQLRDIYQEMSRSLFSLWEMMHNKVGREKEMYGGKLAFGVIEIGGVVLIG